ncbi:HpcH/HpaI aldolase/citrate lyase family protein [Ferrovibrio sp.]|uniref:HpcH/HpaI aldolase family protein n=1 Tax=Ferrovibrio sp. TaxID=1917215 RepID=UPI0035B45EA8
MFRNPLRRVWETGTPALNGWIALPSPLAAEAMAQAGWDSLTIDMQHGTADYADLLGLLPIIEKAGIAPMVRVPWLDEGAIMRALDAGALGIIAPMIETAKDAQRLVDACLYPPQGARSFGPIRARLARGDGYASAANAEVLAFAMIETRAAMENLDEILAVPGLSGLYIGPADLSLAHGFPPGFDREEPEMLAMLDDILARCRAAGLPCGLHCGKAAYAGRMAKRGFALLTVGSDARFIEAAASASVVDFALHRDA